MLIRSPSKRARRSAGREILRPPMQTARLAESTLGVLALSLWATTLTAQTPPWDTSPQAVAARAAFYGVPGRVHLTSADSPLKAGMKIDFFGDSITWLNGYV